MRNSKINICDPSAPAVGFGNNPERVNHEIDQMGSCFGVRDVDLSFLLIFFFDEVGPPSPLGHCHRKEFNLRPMP